jgi:hypothetical protein
MKLVSLNDMKSGKIVSQVGRRYVYKQSFGKKGVTTTLLCCISASGMSIPPTVIFKGVRMNDRLAESPMPSLIRLSPKGRINTGTFVEWFQYSIECIPLTGL